MKNKTILIFLLFLAVSCYAQKYDYIWVRGTGALTPQPQEFGTSFMDFNTTPPTITFGKKYPPLQSCIACISDSTGKLLFFTNLLKVFNANEEEMENGNVINYGKVWLNYQDIGYPSLSCAKIIPIKHDSLFLMIYAKLNTDSLYLINRPVQYAIIDPYFQNNTGKVIQKDVPFHYGNALNYDFVKSGNGRDWWLIICEWNVFDTQQRYYRYLINENGDIDSIGTQIFPLPTRNSGFTRINQLGNTYVRYSVGNSQNLFTIFDIDRCTGKLNFRKNYNYNKIYNTFGFELSPNGRYVYPTKPASIFQIDLESNDQYLFIDSLAYIDGYVEDLFFGSCFGFAQLTPKNEIMILPFICNPKAINIIHQPDLPGPASDFEQHAIIGPNYAKSGPQFPNYRLGALEGSPCDTLGFITNSNAWLFQNDIAAVCVSEVQSTAFKKLILRIYNQEGDNLLEEQFFSTQSQYCLSTSSLIPGEYYYYYLWVDDKKVLKGKFNKL